MNQTAHPSIAELAAFDRGELPSARWEIVQGHVSTCDLCCSKLETIPDDRFAFLLRQAGRRVDTRALHLEATPLLGTAPTPTHPPPVAPDIPEELRDHPRYRVVSTIGKGGMGAVFKAEHRLMERAVALKIIRRDLTARPGVVDRFRQEVKAAARLAHPNIVTAHDADHAGDVHFLVMEYVEGVALERVVAHQGPLPFATACEYILQAALGLQHAHERGMIHRDIKPANLLLAHAGKQPIIKILDFGLARLVSEQEAGSALTETGYVLGTPDFMAPEQASDPRQADIRADLYSLGCTLYYLLTARLPFPEGTPLQKLMARQQQMPSSISGFRRDLPADFLPVLNKLLDPDPARRYQTPTEVAEALVPFARGGGQAPARRRGKFKLAHALLLIPVLAVAGLAYTLWPRTTPPAKVEPPQSVPPLVEVKKPPPGQITCLQDPKPFTQVAFSRDAREALTAAPDGSIQLWNLETGKVVHRFAGHKSPVEALGFSRDFRRAVSGSGSGKLRVWDLEAHQELDSLDANKGGVRAADFALLNNHALCAGQDGNLLAWKLDERRIMHTYRGHHAPINSLFIQDGCGFAITGSADRTARLWDLETGRQVRQYAHDVPVDAAVISHDVYLVLTGCADHSLRLWRTFSEREVQRYTGHKDKVLDVALSRDNRWALSGSADRTARLWDLATGKELARFTHEGSVLRVAFSNDDKRILTGGADGTLRQWRFPPDLDRTPTRYSERVNVVVQSPQQEEVIAYARGDEVVEVSQGKQPGLTLTGHTELVLALAYADDGTLLASGGWDNKVCLWNVARASQEGTRRPLHTLAGHTQPVRALAFSHDGKLLVSGSSDRHLRFWDVESGKLLLDLPAHDAAVRDVEIARDDELLISCAEDGTIRLWDLAAWRRDRQQPPPVKTIVAHGGAVYSVSLSKDFWLASGGADEAVILWDLSKWRTRLPDKPQRILRQHQGNVWSVAFRGDGRTLASGGADHTVQFWDAASGSKRRTLSAFNDEIYSLSYTPNEKMVRVGVLGGSIKTIILTARELPGD
ncbi:MAG: WD40 repeat domain-containing serine/threonine protein kinase [Gemmataceae bacterium]